MNRQRQLSSWAVPPSNSWRVFCPSYQMPVSVTRANLYAQCRRANRASLGHLCVDFCSCPGCVVAAVVLRISNYFFLLLTYDWLLTAWDLQLFWAVNTSIMILCVMTLWSQLSAWWYFRVICCLLLTSVSTWRQLVSPERVIWHHDIIERTMFKIFAGVKNPDPSHWMQYTIQRW